MKKLSLILILCALVCLAAYAGAACADTASDTVIEYEEKTIIVGTPAGDYAVNVRARPDADSSKVASLAPGAECTVYAKSDGWYSVELNGVNGYVKCDLLTLSKRTVTVEHVIVTEDPLEASIEEFSSEYMIAPGQDPQITGVISSNIPIVEVRVSVYDLRQLKTEVTVKASFTREQGVKGYNLKKLASDKALKSLVSGEKKIIITVASANEEQIVAEKGLYVSGKCADPVSMTGSCKISVTHGNTSGMLDDSYATSWHPSSAKDYIKIVLPSGKTANGVALEFDSAPSKMLIEIYGRDGQVIDTIAEKNPNEHWNFYYELPEDILGLKIYTYDSNNGVCKLRVYEKGKVPQAVQRWEDTPEQVDLMLIVAHMNDETLYFSGTLAQLSAQGKNVMVVYMTTDDRNKHAEALDCIWSAGCRIHPVFYNFKDYKVDSYSKAEWLWGEDETMHALASVMRRYKPLVVMTHDTDGEYGHNQHKMTARYTVKCIEALNNPKFDPQSAEQYGTWDVPKFYVHLYDESKRLDLHFSRGMEELDGFSPMQVAFISFDKHQSQIKRYSLKGDGITYDCTWFSLYRSTVGEDVEKNSFFENLE